MKFLGVYEKNDYFLGSFEPTGIMYLLASIREAGHEVMMEEESEELLSKAIEEWKPDFVGYGAYTGQHQWQVDLNRKLKRKYDFLGIFGGPHATFFPEVINNEGIDIVCRGEADDAIVELLDKMERGEDYLDVKNFWFKKNGKIYKNEVRPLVRDIDKYPYPARDLFYNKPIHRNNKIKLVHTARGCPYSCTYCYNSKIKELYHGCGVPHLRFRDVESVVEECRYVKDNYPVEIIYFATDSFPVRKDWVLEFSEIYAKEIGIPWICQAHPQNLSLEVCKAMKKSGCISVLVGVESGDEQIRRELLNRKMSDERIIRTANNVHEVGMNLFTYNMMGLPGETIEQAFKTIEINQKCKTDLVSISLFQPYPSTTLGEKAVEMGYYKGDFDELTSTWFLKSHLKFPEAKKFERLQKLAPITVEFPWLKPLVKIAINLPFNSFYYLIFRVFKAYCYKFRILPIKLSFTDTVKLVWLYFTDKSK